MEKGLLEAIKILKNLLETSKSNQDEMILIGIEKSIRVLEIKQIEINNKRY